MREMLRVLVLLLVGCSPTLHTIKLVNRTDRAIETIHIYPTGSASQGSSRGTLAPNATTEVKQAAGNVDITAASAKVKIDDKTTERRTASGTIPLKGPVEVIFHDSNQPAPTELNQPNTFGITFRVDEPEPEPEPLGPL
jgi:hypothetical protein